MKGFEEGRGRGGAEDYLKNHDSLTNRCRESGLWLIAEHKKKLGQQDGGKD